MSYAITDGPLSILFPTAATGDHKEPDALIMAIAAYVAHNGEVTTEINFSPLLPILYDMFGQKVLTKTLREMAEMFKMQADEIENGTGEGGDLLTRLSEYGFQPE